MLLRALHFGVGSGNLEPVEGLVILAAQVECDGNADGAQWQKGQPDVGAAVLTQVLAAQRDSGVPVQKAQQVRPGKPPNQAGANVASDAHYGKLSSQSQAISSKQQDNYFQFSSLPS